MDNVKINQGLDVSKMNKIEFKRSHDDMEDDPNYNLNLTNDEITEIVNDITSSTLPLKEKELHFSQKYEKFCEYLPFLFKMACEPVFDKATFAFMLSMRSKVMEKNMTEHDASKEVGQKFYDRYMKK